MQEPDTRVVGIVSKNEVPSSTGGNVRRHLSDITTWWINQVECDTAAVSASTLGKDQEVVTVKMDGMRDRSLLVGYDNIDPLAKVRSLDGKVARDVRDRAIVNDRLQSRIRPFGEEARAGQLPLEILSNSSDLDVFADLLGLAPGVPTDDGHEAVVWLIVTRKRVVGVLA